ncbi:MAG: valine--tRNA ligase [Leeuwenhoekiella sp.]
MALASKYDAQQVEDKWYRYWMENKYFHSKPDGREAYTIVIPPPNVTGILHMGHMLNNTIQDVLIRRARLLGYNACWVPGTDHASIATEAKVVAKLKAEGIDKNSLTREEFLKHAWDWTEQYGGKILEQLKKLGASCDWDRTKFTMDEDMSESVIDTFIDLYNKGLIYRGHRMVNWDPEAKTTLSDEEVIYEERQGHLWYLQYKIAGTEDFLTIATTRPETIFGDTAICINPNDKRFTHLKGKKAIVPIVNREVPIIEDEYVDMEFGTGCLKVTPAHDENDKVLGEKHHLEIIDIFNDNATLNSTGLHYEGQDRYIVRKGIVKELEEKGYLLKTENHINKVGTSERTKAVIEPKLSDQWFLKMKDLADPAIKAVLETEEIRLFPKKFQNTYRHWMENVRDWNISRQLWWGQQIPAYYYGNTTDDFVVAKSREEALASAKAKSGNPNLTEADLRQDSDVLDTWFSSWLWPMSVFDGIRNPENEEFNYYYPTNDLVTGPDILFFWVARMIVSGYEYTGKPPFENVYLTGLVRDKQRRKMSKSLGNSPDALELIKEFGADGVRVGLLLSSAAGNDLLFDESLCQQGKGFVNKIWNAFRLIKGWEVDETISQPEANALGLKWYRSRFAQAVEEINDHYSKYRMSDALMATYKLIWDDFCSWLLEIVKPDYQQPIDAKTYQMVVEFLEDNLRILHPFVPFASEEIWQHITERTPEEALIIDKWPQPEAADESLIGEFEITSQVVTGIRMLRKQNNISFREEIDLLVLDNENFGGSLNPIIKKLGKVNSISKTESAVDGALSFRVKANEYFIPAAGAVNVEEELQKITEELDYTRGFLKAVEKKLGNERFVNNAPEAVVAVEKNKQQDALSKIEALEKRLNTLG